MTYSSGSRRLILSSESSLRISIGSGILPVEQIKFIFIKRKIDGCSKTECAESQYELGNFFINPYPAKVESMMSS